LTCSLRRRLPFPLVTPPRQKMYGVGMPRSMSQSIGLAVLALDCFYKGPQRDRGGIGI
jgi:hypothetical protein